MQVIFEPKNFRVLNMNRPTNEIARFLKIFFFRKLFDRGFKLISFCSFSKVIQFKKVHVSENRKETLIKSLTVEDVMEKIKNVCGKKAMKLDFDVACTWQAWKICSNDIQSWTKLNDSYSAENKFLLCVISSVSTCCFYYLKYI